jgi:hypothetical protein
MNSTNLRTANIANIASGIKGMYIPTVSPFLMPASFNAHESRFTS